MNLYKDEIISPEDSLIIILYDPIPENLEKAIEDSYHKGQEEIKINGLSDNIRIQNESLENQLVNEHFKNIHIFHLDTLSIDILNHVHVPEHICIREQSEINKILDQCNAKIHQLPIILRTDAIAKRLRMAPGDICKINRITQTGEIPFYRVCK